MNDKGITWFETLMQHGRDCRLEAPIPAEADLDAVQQFQRRIIGGAILGWMKHTLDGLLKERYVLAQLKHFEENPYIVFCSNDPGLSAAEQIYRPENPRVVYLHPDEFDDFLKRNPDPEYSYHIHFWSHFGDPISREDSQIARDFPVPEPSVYWMHKEGTMFGHLHGRQVDHLWQWDGQEAQLLQEGYCSKMS